MTSNIGSQWITEFKPEQESEIRERIMQALKEQFRPEFLNRVDEIVIFHQLTKEQLAKIIDLQLNQLKKRISDRHIDIVLTQSAKDQLLKEGYDPAYGARPLKRAIQREIETPLARLILKGEVRDGQGLLAGLDSTRGELTFAPQPASTGGSAGAGVN